jgi:spore coat polysaccharide biosynthesis protein SpsF (cytidylyltransferase family)
MTTYIYRNRQEFRLVEESCSQQYNLPDVKVSIDVEKDYRLVRCIYEDLYGGRPIEIDELIDWLRNAGEQGSKRRMDRRRGEDLARPANR